MPDDDKLAATPDVPQALVDRVDPEIQTAATPEPQWLLEARAAINASATLQGLFEEAQTEGHSDDWLVDALSFRLNMRWDGQYMDEAVEAAQYLVDEWRQLGQGVHLVSTETGRVALTLTDDDVYQPAPVPRESGGLAVPLPRIRPDLEAAVITWTFDKAREKRITAELARRGHQTAFLAEVGDPRLLVATRKGRTEIVRQLTEYSPEALLRLLGGTSAAFLQHFDLRGADPEAKDTEGLLGPVEGIVRAASTMNVADPLTTNLHHSRAHTLRGSLPQGWVREIVRALSERIRDESGVTGTRPLVDLRKAHLEGAELWCGPPEVMTTVRRLVPKAQFLPSERSHLFGLVKGKAGIIVVPESFLAGTTEMFDRWEAQAQLDFKLWWNPKAFKYVPVGDLVYQGIVEKRR